MTKPPKPSVHEPFARILGRFRAFIRGVHAKGELHTLDMAIHRLVPRSLFRLKCFVIVAGRPKHYCVDDYLSSGVREATALDLDLLAKGGLSLAAVRNWLTMGAQAWVIQQEDDLLASYWLHGSETYHIDDSLILEAHQAEVWVLWWWVSPDYRRRDLAYQVRKPGVSLCAEAGLPHMLGVVDRLNDHAMKATGRLNWCPLGKVIVLSLLGWSFVIANGSVRWGRWTQTNPLMLRLEDIGMAMPRSDMNG